jgi:peptidoglycan/xylan/chitin deacetylase (PgdA/CDA1 family)
MRLFEEKPLEKRGTQLAEAMSRRAFEQQPTQPIVTNKRRRRWLYSLSLLLVLLLVLGAFLSQALVRSWLSPPAKTNSQLQHLLHPDTSAIHSPDLDNAVNLFMERMLQKNWSAMWSMLGPGAQQVWLNEQDFTHFEQTKFGALELQSYTTGPARISHPWLDPDTTQVFDSAATLSVSLQASVPPGLLTAPSNQALKQGLFKQTLFALIQDSQHTWKVMIAGPADLDAPVLVPAKQPVSDLIIPIFMYHHVSSLPTTNLLDFNLSVTNADFKAQLNWLQRQGYHTITMTELFDTFYYGKALPSKPMILTFDDGYADVYLNALPALLERHYRGVFYIITAMIGGRYVTWNEVRTITRSGMQIASHTVHHVNIGQPPAGMTTQEELLNSKETLENELHEPIQFFCYPSGEPFHHDSLYERRAVLSDLFNDGYLGATLDPEEFDSALQNSQRPYQLPRIRVSGGEDLGGFIGILVTTLRQDQIRLLQLGKGA